MGQLPKFNTDNEDLSLQYAFELRSEGRGGPRRLPPTQAVHALCFKSNA